MTGWEAGAPGKDKDEDTMLWWEADDRHPGLRWDREGPGTTDTLRLEDSRVAPWEQWAKHLDHVHVASKSRHFCPGFPTTASVTN